MFGLRLKSWMEAHLGRPRHKSTSHQSQKRSSKDSTSAASGATNGNSTASINNTTTTTSSLSSTSPTPTAATNSHHHQHQQSHSHLNSGDCPSVKNSNFDSPADFSCSSSYTTTPGVNLSSTNSCVVNVNSSSEILNSAQVHEHESSGELSSIVVTTEEQIQPNRNIVTVSNSNSILLGCFSNNLSSPDTGYSSTDGYSPKSVYPALSFESSGKSTPKSSYTISSLVSSELLNKNTPSPSQSQTFSVQNGLELDECTSPPPPSVSNPVLHCPKGESSSSLQMHSQSQSQSDVACAYSHSVSDSTERKSIANVNQILPVIVGDGRKTDDNVCASPMSMADTNTLSTSTSTSLSLSNSTSSTNQSENNFLSNLAPSIVISSSSSGMSSSSNRSLLSTAAAGTPNNKKREFNSHLVTSSLINSSLPVSSNKNTENNHRKVEEGMEEPDRSQISNSSSTVAGRSIRTSLSLSSAASASIPASTGATTGTTNSTNGAISTIADSNNSNLGVGIKNSFSLSSPRRERTRIKTNPWISISHHNDGNSHANNNNSGEQGRLLNSSATPSNSDTESGTGVCGDSSLNDRSEAAGIVLVASSDSTANHTGVSGGETISAFTEINKRESVRDTLRVKDHDSQMLYRISTSTSASDSGKGTLEPGTNRNSTESSCLLSDSTSTRNSIISHENDSPGSGASGNSANDSGNVTSNTHGHANGPPLSFPSQKRHQTQSSSSASPRPVKASESLSVKTTPICMSKFDSNRRLNSGSGSAEPKSEDNTNTSTTFGELIGKYSESSSYPNMVDKETDILSDWANTDEDGEDEIETDQNDNDTVTPTPSSPDTGGRIVLTTSQSNSSATDLDFIDTTHHRHYSQNINKHAGGVSSTNKDPPPPIPTPYHPNMNLPTTTTCYTSYQALPIQIPIQIPTEIPDAYAYVYDTDTLLNQSELMANHALSLSPSDAAAMKTARCYNTRISDGSPSPPHKTPGTNSNNIARGALGFLRKIFKKGSCSSQRTSPGSGKVKMSRGRGDSRDNNNVPAVLRSPLLADIETVNNYPLSNTKPLSPAINGYFLTPTPNSFRRRSGTGTDSSDSRSSKQPKGIKTDIIRLPGPPLALQSQSLSSTQSQVEALLQQQSFSSTSSSATNPSRSSNASRNTNGNCDSHFTGTNGHPPHGILSNNTNVNTNTNSTSGSGTGSSVHCMSTSTSASGGIALPTQNQLRISDTTIGSSNMKSSAKESPFMSGGRNSNINEKSCTSVSNISGNMSPMLMSHGNGNAKLISSQTAVVTSQSQSQIIVLQQNQQLPRDILPPGAPSPKIVLGGAGGHCSFEAQSPRLQNNSTRINSPSFNNYSPIHRLVVTGGNHLLSRGVNAPSTSGASSSFHTVAESPLLISRNGNGNIPSVPCSSTNNGLGHHNNTNNSTGTPHFIPNSQIINRPVVSASSPLINHRHSISSPHPPHHSFAPPFASPSPILRNPRYQYITSSNQNSPVLNVPKRINIPLHHSQNAYPHPNGLGGSPMISFSPVPVHQSHQRKNSNSNHVNVSPNLNSANHQPFQQKNRRSSIVGYDFDYENQQQQIQLHRFTIQGNGAGNGNIPSSSVHVPLNQSHSFTSGASQQNHYYSSPVIQQRNLERSHQYQQQQHHNEYFVNSGGGVGGSGSVLVGNPSLIGEMSESPGAVRQRYHQSNNYQRNSNLTNHNEVQFPLSSATAAGMSMSMPMSPQERIYETVDSDEDDVYVSDEGDGNGGEFEFDMPLPYNPEELYRRSNNPYSYHGAPPDYVHKSLRSNASSSQTQSQPKFQPSSKSKRSKKSLPIRPAPQPPPVRKVPTNLPMMLGTYLSETETRLLEDRKYKQLINEAEALLKEISIEKSKPWTGRPDALRHEECPQSDPLKRKAYDCWALRRLQQELAGCCASPPVLHRSRLNLTSPSSPNASSHPYLNHNLSLVQVHSDAAFMNALSNERNANANRDNPNSNF